MKNFRISLKRKKKEAEPSAIKEMVINLEENWDDNLIGIMEIDTEPMSLEDIPDGEMVAVIITSDMLVKQFEAETGKHAIWHNKETKQYLKWLEDKE